MNYKVVDELVRNSIIVVPVGSHVHYDDIISEIINELEIDRILDNSTEKQDLYCYYPKLDCYLAFINLFKKEDVTYEDIKNIYGNFIRSSFPDYFKSITIVIPEIDSLDYIKTAQSVYEGIKLGSYVFDKERFCSKDSSWDINLFVGNKNKTEELFSAIDITNTICNGVIMARDLVNQPGSKLYPKSFVDYISKEVKNTEISIKVFDETELQKKNIIGVYSVGKGSINLPRLAILKYLKSNSAPNIALVGKGVTTDLGGVNLKIGSNLSPARTDMGGAAAVLAVMKTLSTLGVEANVIAIIPMVENIYDANSLKPGEVIQYNNGITVEIRNTDAEGRLLLADGILLAKEMKADIIVDIATLTGSCINALGSRYAGILGTDEIVKDIIEAGRETDEMYWQLPLPEAYKRGLESDIADMGNTSAEEPSVITAALFLKEFAGDSDWAHIDIAGTRNSSSTYGYITKGGTGFGVKALLAYIEKISKQ